MSDGTRFSPTDSTHLVDADELDSILTDFMANYVDQDLLELASLTASDTEVESMGAESSPDTPIDTFARLGSPRVEPEAPLFGSSFNVSSYGLGALGPDYNGFDVAEKQAELELNPSLKIEDEDTQVSADGAYASQDDAPYEAADISRLDNSPAAENTKPVKPTHAPKRRRQTDDDSEYQPSNVKKRRVNTQGRVKAARVKGGKTERKKLSRCNKCKITFTRPEDLARHLETSEAHTGGSKLRCPKCGAGISRQDALRRHMLSASCQ